jgi:hypothetical protein
MTITDYIVAHVDRGECKCGKCIDVADKADPVGHTADLVFFKVAAKGEPSADEFRRLTEQHKGEFADCNPFDGNEHGYMELGGWIGDQGLALMYMGLGAVLGVFELLTPRLLPGLPESLVMQMAGSGLVTVKTK